MRYVSRPGYMTIKEAAVRYEVSRSKLHRLATTGRVQTEKDPRDERATLIRIEDLEALFQFPTEEAMNAEAATPVYDASGEGGEYIVGRLTAEWRNHIDALRTRVMAGRRFAEDSVDIIREGREARSADLEGGGR